MTASTFIGTIQSPNLPPPPVGFDPVARLHRALDKLEALYQAATTRHHCQLYVDIRWDLSQLLPADDERRKQIEEAGRRITLHAAGRR